MSCTIVSHVIDVVSGMGFMFIILKDFGMSAHKTFSLFMSLEVKDRCTYVTILSYSTPIVHVTLVPINVPI